MPSTIGTAKIFLEKFGRVGRFGLKKHDLNLRQNDKNVHMATLKHHSNLFKCYEFSPHDPQFQH